MGERYEIKFPTLASHIIPSTLSVSLTSTSSYSTSPSNSHKSPVVSGSASIDSIHSSVRNGDLNRHHCHNEYRGGEYCKREQKLYEEDYIIERNLSPKKKRNIGIGNSSGFKIATIQTNLSGSSRTGSQVSGMDSHLTFDGKITKPVDQNKKLVRSNSHQNPISTFSANTRTNSMHSFSKVLKSESHVKVLGSENEGNHTLGLFDFLWEDTLFIYCLPRLSWEDLFRLRRVSTQSCALVTMYFSQLKRLDLSSVKGTFNDQAFKVVTGNCKILRKLILPNAPWVKDENLNKVFRSNKLLTYVDLSGCRDLKGTSVLALAVSCKTLTTLHLRECLWLNRGAVETLMAHLRHLSQVDFTSCSTLCHNQISSFVRTFPRLTRFHVAYIQSVNDLTVIMIARTCRELVHLDVRSCMNVTDHGIRALAEFSPKLKTLCVSNCNLVTDFSLQAIRSRGTVTVDRPSLVDPALVDVPIALLPRLQV